MTRFLIAGTRSGCGKTTITCAILAALRQRGLRLSAFKCGPDYIDPMFHREVLGVPAHNLDSFFCHEDRLRYLLQSRSEACDAAVLEGVMGYYDGSTGSAYSVARATHTPAVIVIDCKGMSDSIGAIMLGFLRYREPSQIAGFLFNRLPEKLVPLAKRLCDELKTGYFGTFPQHSHTLASRHLGLVTAGEIEGLQAQLSALGALAEQHLCLDALLALDAPAVSGKAPQIRHCKTAPVIAVARDRAFCFHYAENLELLAEMGCRLHFFSPLADASLPDAQGLLLCGGYPELHAQALSDNAAMRRCIRTAIRAGMPTIAECGGFLYLHDFLQVKDGTRFPMVGAIPGTAFPTGRLGRFGYVMLQARSNNLLCDAGETLRGHEFHYWDSPACGTDFHAEKPDGRQWDSAHATPALYAGFPHLYWYGNIAAAERFVRAAAQFGGMEWTDSDASAP